MTAQEEITHLINKYAFTVDEGDLDAWASLFEHGELKPEIDQPAVAGKEALLRGIKALIILHHDGTPRTKHLVSNVDIVVAEDGCSATSRCYFTVVQQTDSFPLKVIASGEYLDDFENVDGEWRFARREIKTDFVGDLSAHMRSK